MTKTKQGLKELMNRVIRYFLQGLLLIAPIFVTLYSIFALFNMLDSTANDMFEAIFKFRFPGLGLMVMFFVVTVIGAVGSTIFIQPIMDGLESLLERTPLVKDIYSSIRDFVSAFLSNKKKFNKPVIVEMGKGLGIYKLGFITDADLGEFGITDKVAVYFPHSYNFSGNLFIVNADQVKELPTSNGSADVMKYIVSGGVMEMEDSSEKQNQ